MASDGQDIVRELAERMRLSPRTIYRALRNDVSENRPNVFRRAEAIRDLAAQLGYRTNVAARSIREGSFRQIAFVSARLRGAYAYTLSNYLAILSERLVRQGYHLLVEEFLVDRVTGRLAEPHRLFREHSVDGVFVVVADGHFPREMERAMLTLALPRVWLNYTPALENQHFVTSDETAAIDRLVAHFAALGHRRVAFLTLDAGHYSVRHRHDGLLRAAGRHGVELETIHTNATRYESSIRPTVTRFLDTHHPRCRAAVCYNANFMRGLRLEAGRRGLAIPRDLSIGHFASINETGEMREFPATAVLVPEEAMSVEALRVMDALIAGQAVEPRRLAVPAAFVAGESTGPADAP